MCLTSFHFRTREDSQLLTNTNSHTLTFIYKCVSLFVRTFTSYAGVYYSTHSYMLLHVVFVHLVIGRWYGVVWCSRASRAGGGAFILNGGEYVSLTPCHADRAKRKKRKEKRGVIMLDTNFAII